MLFYIIILWYTDYRHLGSDQGLLTVRFEGVVVETGSNDTLTVEVPQLIMTVELSRPDDHVGSRHSIRAIDVEHLAVHLADDEESSTGVRAHSKNNNNNWYLVKCERDQQTEITKWYTRRRCDPYSEQVRTGEFLYKLIKQLIREYFQDQYN